MLEQYRNILFLGGRDIVDIIIDHLKQDPTLVRTIGDQLIEGKKTFSQIVDGTAERAKWGKKE